ncbi:MAG: hypothetical protein HN441_04605 [Candidatus Thioglobus sp.]|jgi:hypothetical protein|nr:hypothetical protein [Candidatus Thioglobus sp.]MBT6753044.1 hypothetical protein [Candidatus Thioglobus sp.]
MFTLKKSILLISVIATIFVSGCANRPESIAASYVSHERYSGQSCDQLSAAMSSARAELTLYSDKQDTSANMDAGSVFLILIPQSAFAGDHEAEVAKWKGRVEAIETAQIKADCMKGNK